MNYKLCTIIALVSFLCLHAHSGVSPTLTFRSQGFHGDRQRNVGMADKINRYDLDAWYGAMDIGIGYMRSFDSEDIARCLFGCDLICNDNCNNTIKVQGSGVASRDAKAWLADYFYLNCDYDGSFSIRPRIQNIVVDLDFYLGLDDWVEGMYIRLYGPINWTKWDTRFCVSDPETVITTSCSTGYFTSTGSELLLSSLASYFTGNAPTPVSDVTFHSLKWAKMKGCDDTKIGLAELRAECGWNFYQDYDYHVGAGIHVAAPTGNKRKAEYVMYPVSGNGNHWELGGTLHGHYRFWTSDDEEKHVGFYFDAVLTHLFKAREQRTFDLCGNNNSRYMLAAKYTRSITTDLQAKQVQGSPFGLAILIPFAQFNNVYTPVANLTTANLKVDVALQADVTAMFNFTRKAFSLDVGYNFWGKTCEKIECPLDCDSCNADSIFNNENANTWALKGDARMFGFASASSGSFSVGDPIPLSATQSNATIHAGTNAGTTDATLTSVTLQNGGIDNSSFADLPGTPFVIHTPPSEGGLNVDTNQIKTSIQPVFLNSKKVGLQKTKGLSHKIFTHLNYTWDRDDWDWTPYFGVGGSAEFGHNDCCNDSDCSTSCSTSSAANCESGCSSIDCALSQWSVWAKGGISFD